MNVMTKVIIIVWKCVLNSYRCAVKLSHVSIKNTLIKGRGPNFVGFSGIFFSQT